MIKDHETKVLPFYMVIMNGKLFRALFQRLCQLSLNEPPYLTINKVLAKKCFRVCIFSKMSVDMDEHFPIYCYSILDDDKQNLPYIFHQEKLP